MSLISLLPEVTQKANDAELLNKMNGAKKSTAKKTSNILTLLSIIREDVNANLGEYTHLYRCITTKDEFKAYIQKANKFGLVSIDTETTGLNPLVDRIVGLSMYFPEEQGIYVPINHVDYFSGVRIEEQLTEDEVNECLKDLTANIIMHNSQFDIRIFIHTCGVRLSCWWDTQVAATLLNENEPHGLKYLHGKYISHKDEKTFSDLFGAIDFTMVPIELAFPYAAHDAVDTYDLYKFQEKFFNDTSRDDRVKLNWLYRNIEIPMIDVIVDLEDTGIAIDTEYLDSIYNIYHKNLDEALEKCYQCLNTDYKEQIDIYKAKNPINKLDDPISIGSATQLAILLYDILEIKPIKGKGARSTDVDVMETLKKKYPIAQYILDYRSAKKFTSTYIDNIPNIIHTDGRVHTHFNSNGARTGRMSSSDPINLQNIPSHDETIRKMFVGQTTYRDIELIDNKYILDRSEEVEMQDGSWKWAELLKPDEILSDGSKVLSVTINNFSVEITTT